MFLAVKYRATDYNYEASASHRMMISSLMLTVPIQLDNNIYPHSGKLQDDSYRRPWCGCFGTLYELEYTESVVEYLQANLCLMECVERFMVCTGELGEDVVPSSNPASPRCLESQEVLCLLNTRDRAAEQDAWTETFAEVDVHSVYFSEQDLFLPEEVMMNDDQLKSYLPSLFALLKRLKPYPLSNLLHAGPLLPEHVIIREFSPYSPVPSDAPASCSAPWWDIEHFGKETLLDAEDLMLLEFIETDVVQKRELLPSHELQVREALSPTPELYEEQSSVLDTLRTSMETTSEREDFIATETDITDPAPERTFSPPLPFRSCVELELDLILSPPPAPPPPSDRKLFLSTNQLSAEMQSPHDRVRLVTDSEREALEKDVWMAEKYPLCVARFLLTEPGIPGPPVRRHPLPHLLSTLQLHPEYDDMDRSCPPSLQPLMTSDPILDQALTVETHTAVNTQRPEVDMTEQFTPLSFTQIDELLGESETLPSPTVESRALCAETAVTACVRKNKTVRFNLQTCESPRRSSEKTKRDTRRPSARYAQKHSILLKSESKPAETRKFNPSTLNKRSPNKLLSETTPTDRGQSPLSTPTRYPPSTQRELRFEKCNNTNPHDHLTTQNTQQNRAGSLQTPEHAQSTASKPSSDLSQTEEASVQHAVPPFSYSATRSHPGPSNVLPEKPATNCIELKSIPTAHTHTGTMSQTSNASGTPKPFGVTPTLSKPPHQGGIKTPRSAWMKAGSSPIRSTEEYLDPVSSFMMLRGVLTFPVDQTPDMTPLRTPGEFRGPAVHPANGVFNRPCHLGCVVSETKSQKPREAPGRMVLQEASEKKKTAGSEPRCPAPERAVCNTIHVPPTDTERSAFWELSELARPVLSRVLGSGTLRNTDFSSLTPEHTRFCLKLREKQLRTGKGRECEYNDVALLHILVTLKGLLLRCDLNTATGYLKQAHSTCTLDGLGELLRKFQVLQYLSRKWAEPQLRVQHLQEQVSTWLQRTSFQKILIVMAVENVRAEVVLALSQIPGNLTSMDINNMTDSRCVVVCVQQLQCGFPWQRFSAVFEFQCLGDSAVRSTCAKNQIQYTRFTTAAPCPDPSAVFCSPLERVPFVLFITEGLLKHRELLQLLESTYNMTLLERMHSPSLQRLGLTHLYDIITVDENTAILLQEVVELEQERSAERVVLRLSALSLQFSLCWVVLHCSNHYRALVNGEVFGNLVLIYSASLLFGQKPDGLDIKVLLAYNVADMARCVHQVCLHTLLHSQRDVRSWLDREWFSLLPTEEEQCLLYFPCVNSVAAQLLLSRAPSVQWLLESSHTQLEEMFPEITPSVFKLFSDSTAAYRLHIAAPQCEDEVTHIHYWGLDMDDSLSNTHSDTPPRSPGVNQEPGSVGRGWFGAESQGLTDTQYLAEEETQAGGETDEQWSLEAPSLTSSLSFTHSHTASCRPFTQKPWAHLTPSLLPQQQWGGNSRVCERDTERKRPAGGGAHTVVFGQGKRGRLLFERVPGRTDGQTRLRFF